MKTYDFDKVIDRVGTSDVKHAMMKELFGRDDLLGLWVADMDWPTPDFVMDALKARLEHPILGYTSIPDEYWTSIINWQRKLHGFEVQRQWLSYIPGIVKGIGMVLDVFTKPGDKIVVQPPVYHPFHLLPTANGREVVWNPLKRFEQDVPGAPVRYEMDFEHLESVCDSTCKVFILCNPHNPAGICWSRETLQRLAHFCTERNILVISDEIHSDMALYGHKHLPFASVSDEAANCSISFAAPSKTFNIAGVVSSYSIVPNETLRKQFYSWLEANEFGSPTLFAPIATIAAFEKGEQWRQQMLRYVEDNVEFVIDYCATHIPQIRPLRPEVSFLVWLDCRKMGLSHDEMVNFFVNKTRLAMNSGAMFGPGGEGFMRLNVGTPRCVLEEALSRIKSAFN